MSAVRRSSGFCKTFIPPPTYGFPVFYFSLLSFFFCFIASNDADYSASSGGATLASLNTMDLSQLPRAHCQLTLSVHSRDFQKSALNFSTKIPYWGKKTKQKKTTKGFTLCWTLDSADCTRDLICWSLRTGPVGWVCISRLWGLVLKTWLYLLLP